ncbi:MAG TPA: tetratricopeptide repeat protein [Anaerolineae bacterium]|nr:tetratricopeptide repeat protein [Anaerolineae bacterium]
MRKTLVLISILLLAALAVAGCGQSAEKLNNKGNEAFASQDYQGALTAYRQAQEDVPELAEPHYNAANTHYRLEDYEQAQLRIEQALVSEDRREALGQSSYYNLGNVFFQAQQFEAAIEAYKEALRLNPDDLQAKQNLEFALRQLQQQQQQEQQNQDQQQDQQNQDQQQDQQNQDQQNQDQQQDQQNQDQQQDQQNQDQQQDQQNQDQQQDGQADGQPKQLLGLTEEQARQMFEAAAQGTESLEEFLQQILVFPGAPPTEDW